MKIFSDLNLNGHTPPRVQPKVGEWGPLRVPSTAAKKRMRIWVSLAFVATWTAMSVLGGYIYKKMMEVPGS